MPLKPDPRACPAHWPPNCGSPTIALSLASVLARPGAGRRTPRGSLVSDWTRLGGAGMLDTDSPGKRSPSRRGSLRLEADSRSRRVLALAFLCGALWSLGLSVMTGGSFSGLRSWAEGASRVGV